MVPLIFEPSLSLISSAHAAAASGRNASAARPATEAILRFMRSSIALERACGKRARDVVAWLVSKSCCFRAALPPRRLLDRNRAASAWVCVCAQASHWGAIRLWLAVQREWREVRLAAARIRIRGRAILRMLRA